MQLMLIVVDVPRFDLGLSIGEGTVLSAHPGQLGPQPEEACL